MTHRITLKDTMTTLEQCYIYRHVDSHVLAFISLSGYHKFMNRLPKRLPFGELAYVLLLFQKDLRLLSHVIILNGYMQFLN